MKLIHRFATLATLAALSVAAAPLAADDSVVVLPLEAQTCDLPPAPSRIPPDADYDGLVKGKQNIADFQTAMVQYRGCLDAASDLDTLTDGNRQALIQAHNYSVEMEERMAEQFNVAVRNYKARQAESKQD